MAKQKSVQTDIVDTEFTAAENRAVNGE